MYSSGRAVCASEKKQKQMASSTTCLLALFPRLTIFDRAAEPCGTRELRLPDPRQMYTRFVDYFKRLYICRIAARVPNPVAGARPLSLAWRPATIDLPKISIFVALLQIDRKVIGSGLVAMMRPLGRRPTRGRHHLGALDHHARQRRD